MTRDEACERLAGVLDRWRDRVASRVECAALLRERGNQRAMELADAITREAVGLERNVLALSLLLSSEGDNANG